MKKIPETRQKNPVLQASSSWAASGVPDGRRLAERRGRGTKRLVTKQQGQHLLSLTHLVGDLLGQERDSGGIINN